MTKKGHVLNSGYPSGSNPSEAFSYKSLVDDGSQEGRFKRFTIYNSDLR
jgi:hypothetical protein